MALQVQVRNGGIVMALKVVPGAVRQRIAGELGGMLKVAVSKPPERGAANRAIIELLADVLDIPASDIQIIRGQSSPRKEIFLRGVTVDVLASRLKLPVIIT
jgi:uncharacterized protein (TIGR00251 family)